MHQAVLNVGLTENIGGKDTLYRSPSSREGTSFHLGLFGFLGRVPRRFIVGVLLALLVGVAWAAPDINTEGERVSLASHLVEGKTNVVFFYARWNKTSMRYKEKLDDWKGDKDVVLHTVNVKALNSPVSKQFKLSTLPAFEIYDEEGRLKMKDQSALNEVMKLKMLD